MNSKKAVYILHGLYFFLRTIYKSYNDNKIKEVINYGNYYRNSGCCRTGGTYTPDPQSMQERRLIQSTEKED